MQLDIIDIGMLESNKTICIQATNKDGDLYIFGCSLEMIEMGKSEEQPGRITLRILNTTVSLVLPSVKIR